MWKQIVAPAFVVSLCWFLVGGTSSYYISWQDRAFNRTLEENVTSIRAAVEMQEIRSRMRAVTMEAARNQTAVPEDVLSDHEQQFRKSLAQAEASAETAEERALVSQIRSAFDNYVSRWRTANSSRPTSRMRFAPMPSTAQISEPCQRYIQINERLMYDATKSRQQFSTWVIWGRTVMLVVGPGLGLGLGFYLARQLNQSIARISIRLKNVVGDLKEDIGRLELTPGGELPAIQEQLDVVADRIRQVMTELGQARQEALRTERLAAVGELAAGVAHEMRNPLTSVKLLIQTIQHRGPDALPPMTFDVVLEEIGRMESTIQSLLDFARPQKLHRARHDLRQIVRQAVNLSEGRAGQSQVKLVTHQPSEPVWVNADADQLHQVCINLLLNGIESMSDGGKFDIRVDQDDLADVARVRFEDCGSGIPDHVLPRLFEPFVTSKDHGTGLGLAVSRRIVSSHSGQLVADNRPGGGAAMTLELPLDHVPELRIESHAHAAAG